MLKKVMFDNVPESDVKMLETPDYQNIMKASIAHSDAVIIASENLSDELVKFVEASGKPFLPFVDKDKFAEAYTNFYRNQVL